MATNPEDIQLTDDHRRRVARIADRTGTSRQAVVDSIMAYIEQMQPKKEAEQDGAKEPTGERTVPTAAGLGCLNP